MFCHLLVNDSLPSPAHSRAGCSSSFGSVGLWSWWSRCALPEFPFPPVGAHSAHFYEFLPYLGGSAQCSCGPSILHSSCPLSEAHPSSRALLTSPRSDITETRPALHLSKSFIFLTPGYPLLAALCFWDEISFLADSAWTCTKSKHHRTSYWGEFGYIPHFGGRDGESSAEGIRSQAGEGASSSSPLHCQKV